MEKRGRATIDNQIQQLMITIPSQRPFGIVLFMSVWFLGWFSFGLIGILGSIFGNGIVFKEGVGLVFPFLWAFPLVLVGSQLYWYLWGKEIITISAKDFSIHKEAALFSKPQNGQLNEIREIQVYYKPKDDYLNKKIRNDFEFPWQTEGRIAFNSGLKTYYFGNDVEDAEAKYLVHQMVKLEYLTPLNFKSQDEFQRFLKMF